MLTRLLEMNVSDAEDFLVAFAIGLAATVVPAEPPVPVAATPVPVLVEFDSWNRTWGEFSGVADEDVVLTLEDGKREITCEFLAELLDEDEELEEEDELLELVLELEELEVEVDELDVDDELGVGIVVGVGVGVGEGEALEDWEEPDELEADESPAGNRTTFAVAPEGMVTTQNAAPPAPSAESELVTSFIALTEGSMEQGRPLQPEPLHSTLRPKVGLVLLREQPVKMGL